MLKKRNKYFLITFFLILFISVAGYCDVQKEIDDLYSQITTKNNLSCKERLSKNEFLVQLLQKKYPKNANTATAINLLALNNLKCGDHSKAEKLLFEALKIRQSLFSSDHIHVIDSFIKVADLYYRKDDYQKAIKFYKKAFDSLNKNKKLNPKLLSIVSNNLAQSYHYLDDFNSSEKFNIYALDCRKNNLDIEIDLLAESLNNLGSLYSDFGYYDKALKCFSDAISFAIEESNISASIFNSFGVFHYRIGEYGNSEKFYKHALNLSEIHFGKKSENCATIYNNLGVLYQSIGDFERAIENYSLAFDLRKELHGIGHKLVAESMNNIAMLYYQNNNLSKASEIFEIALDNIKKFKGNNSKIEKQILLNFAFVHLEQGNKIKAYEIFSYLNNNGGKGRCFLEQNELLQAVNYFKKSLAISIKNNTRELIIGDLIGLGLTYEKLKNYYESKRYFLNAIELIEKERKTTTFSLKNNFLISKIGCGFYRLDAYEGIIRVLIKQKGKNYQYDSLKYAERAKSKLFLSILSSIKNRSDSIYEQSIIDIDDDFLLKLNSIQKELDNISKYKNYDMQNKIQALKKIYNITAYQYEKFLEEIKFYRSDLYELIEVNIPDLTQIKNLLNEKTSVIEFFSGKNNTFVWIITYNEISVMEIKASERFISENISNLLAANLLYKNNDYKRSMLLYPIAKKQEQDLDYNKSSNKFLNSLSNFYDILFSNIKIDSKIEKLVIIPHGALHRLPFAALYDGNRFLIDRFEISILPSSSSIFKFLEKENLEDDRLLAFGNPKTNYLPLEFAENEVISISKYFSIKRLYFGIDAKESIFKQEASNWSVIHFACHAEFSEFQPMQSCLILSRDENERLEDGNLQIHEIMKLNLKKTKLITLSACETGFGHITSGDDIFSLANVFLYSGAQAVLASLWSVEDESTAILMKEFYENWQSKKLTKSASLKKAILYLKNIEKYKTPEIWSAFQLFEF